MLLGGQTQKTLMGEGCGTYVGAEKGWGEGRAHRILIRKSEEKRPFQDVGVGGRAIVKLH